MEYYAIFIPDKKTDFSIKSFYNVKAEALAVLKLHKEARMKAFSSSDEAVSFYLHGPTETFTKPATPIISSPKPLKSPFVAPTSQKLVAFRKLIEANNVAEVCATIQNPRYLVSSGDTPTILKEGPRYNALHVAAIKGRGEICRLILQTIESSVYVEKLHGLRTTSTDEVSAILLDLYLNTPDKCRSETPLHFASKHGSVDVVKELIAYPQCQVLANADGLFPRDIICSRAEARNDTPDVRESIRALLDEHFFVPLVRYEDNLIPPTIGKPFSPTRPHKLDEPSSPSISPRGEVKAYAGPMDRNKADSFYRRWKTPPRLVVMSPHLMQARSEEVRRDSSSTPIKGFRQPRRLFANRSLDNALFEGLRIEETEQQENNNLDETRTDFCDTNDTDDAATVDSSSMMKPLEEDHVQDNNGNLVSPVVSTPIRLFHQYRNLANDMDSTVDSDASFGEGNFSYLCDETRTVYDRARLRDTPTHKERSLRLSNIDKGLETLGRMLASNENVGWKEHWAFLGKFCDLSTADGLQLFEEYLKERHKATETEQDSQKPIQEDTVSVGKANGGPAGSTGESNGMHLLCEHMEKFSIRDTANNAMHFEGSMMLGDGVHLLEQRETAPQSQLANPYLCVTSSLKMLATRFLTILHNTSQSLQANQKNNAMHKSSFLHVVQKLDTMVENFRADAAFREMNFEKAHTLFAYLVVALMDDRGERKEVRFAPLNQPDQPGSTGPTVPAAGDVACSFECIKHSLVHALYDHLAVDLKLADETESDCRRLWQEESLITGCSCRPQIGISLAMRRKERVKRREERSKGLGEVSLSARLQWGSDAAGAGTSVVCVDYKTYRSIERTPSPPNTPPSHGLRSAKAKGFGFSSDEDDVYLSCSDSEEEKDFGNIGDDENDVFFTPSSSPTGGRSNWDSNNNAELMRAIQSIALAPSNDAKDTPQLFIAGTTPTKQDFDVWTVLEGVEIDESELPLVHAWKCAMREHVVGSKLTDCDESKGVCGF